MKKLKHISLVMLSVMLLASCQSRESKIEQLVTSHLEQSLENPQNLKVLEIDSFLGCLVKQRKVPGRDGKSE